MKKSLVLFLLFLFIATFGGCSASQPPKDFLDSKIGVVYSNGVLYVPSETLKLSEFVGKGLKPGKWEKAENNQWVYRIKNTDAVTKKENESAILFVKHPERQDTVVLARVAINNIDFNSFEKDAFFNQLVFPLINIQKEEKTSSKSNSEQENSQQMTSKASDPCAGAETTAEINECATKKFEDADRELNIAYKEIMAKLDEKKKANLKNEQRAWIKQKETKCKEEAKEVEGGTMWTSVYYGCLTEMTKQRAQQLKSYN